MSKDIRKAESGSKTIYLKVGVWWDEAQGHIHLTAPSTDYFHTTVNGHEKSKRGHPNLFMKLARALKEAGVPGPEVPEKDDA